MDVVDARPGSSARKNAGHGRIPQLDGLRGVAVLLVLSAHLLAGVYPHNRPFLSGTGGPWGGGVTGVQLFFVLSGFLITSILLREHERTNRIRLGAFYGRRARRLLPALFVACLVYMIYATVAQGPAERPRAAGAVTKAMTYTADLDNVPGGVPILRTLPDSGWLGHTWSLAVEEQFYLVWPVSLILAARWGRKGIATAAIAGIVITIVVRQSLPGLSSFAYTSLRWDALLMGCLVAVVPVRVTRLQAWAAAAILAIYTVRIPDPVRPLDFLVIAVACTVVLLRALQVGWLCHPVLRWFGLVSYGLYIWHLLVMRLGLPGPVSLVLSLTLAQLSYTFVELPFLKRNEASRRRQEDGSAVPMEAETEVVPPPPGAEAFGASPPRLNRTGGPADTQQVNCRTGGF